MTVVKYHIGKEVIVQISGHAGAKRQNGADLCCAAESMLAFTLADTLNRLNLPKLKTVIYDGYMCISFGLFTTKAFAAISALYTVLNGFRLVCKKYPQNVCIKKVKEVQTSEQIYC